MTDTHHQILIIGGGNAGIVAAAQLFRHHKDLDIGIVEPAEYHYYQPAWTLVGAGTYHAEETYRPMRDVMPPRATWIQDSVTEVDPDEQFATTNSGTTIAYDYLVVAPGIQINWDGIKGLPETITTNGVCSNYKYEYAPYTWEALREFRGGKMLFTQPSTPIKCGGAPQKIMYLAEEYIRNHGLRPKSEVHFYTPGTVIFGVEFFAKTLRSILEERDIQDHYGYDLQEIKGDEKKAVFRKTSDGETTTEEVDFDLIHVVPPMSAPDFVRKSKLAVQEGDSKGWVDVDHQTLQHNRYPNVFSLGDVAALPTAKTGSAIRKQSPVMIYYLLKEMGKKTPPGDAPIYKGYSSCPLVTGYGKMVLAEFDYNNDPMPTFPFDQSEQRYDMWILKKFGLPWMYWNLMLQGKA